MREQLLETVHGLKDEFLADLKTILQVESVKSDPEPNAPFGEGPKTALLTMLDIAARMGFETHLVEDAVGYIQLGDTEEYIGVMGHLDVVPAGDETLWDYPPFDLTVVDDMLYGRGVLDNKGPILSCLYALYVLKKLDVPVKKSIRVLFGTDEESGSADIPMYLAHHAPPTFGFTPDCKYPVVYGEMGYLNMSIQWDITDDSGQEIQSLTGEFHSSAVPSSLTATFKTGETVVYEGKAAPSNAPELADNVILQLAHQQKEGPGSIGQIFQWIDAHFDNVADAKEVFGLAYRMMPVPYGITLNENELKLDITVRYDANLTEELVVNSIKKGVIEQYRILINRSMPSVVHDATLPEIAILSDAYGALTGLDATPVTTTGATYARTMPNIVAFGPSFPGQKGIAHLPNEWMTFSDLMKNFEIYTLAIYGLSQ